MNAILATGAVAEPTVEDGPCPDNELGAVASTLTAATAASETSTRRCITQKLRVWGVVWWSVA